MKEFLIEQFMDPLAYILNVTSLYTSRGRGRLRNDIHALVNFCFIFFAVFLEDKTCKVPRLGMLRSKKSNMYFKDA